jgi:alkylation response protein AidB-like acyl-CoA dehydrogenase
VTTPAPLRDGGALQPVDVSSESLEFAGTLRRSITTYAAWTADSDPANVSHAAALANLYAADAFVWAAKENIQIHGSVGVTWECSPHLYTKRAKANHMLLGDPWALRHHIAADAIGVQG